MINLVKQKLMSCPWCQRASNVKLIDFKCIKEPWVFCGRCGASGPSKKTEEAAIIAWNRIASKARRGSKKCISRLEKEIVKLKADNAGLRGCAAGARVKLAISKLRKE